MNAPVWLFFGAAIAGGLLGLFVQFQSSGDAAARSFFFFGMTLLSAESLFAGLSAMVLLPESIVIWQKARLSTMALLPGAWLLFSLAYARANSQEYLRRWRLFLVASFVLPLSVLLTGWGTLVPRVTPPGMDVSAWVCQLGISGKLLHVLLLLSAVLILANLERTFRSTSGTKRWQVKYMVLGVGAVFAFRIHSCTQALLYSEVNPRLESLNAFAVILGGGLVLRSLGRTRLLGSNLYVSHAALCRSTAAVLSGLYLLVVGAFASLATRLGGIHDFPLKTFIIFMGLIGFSVALSSDRARLHLKRLVSRHFHRPQYDYRRVWATFTERTAGLTERGPFCRAVVRMVSETLEALSVTLWLTDTSRGELTFGGSTSVSQDRAEEWLEGAGGDGDVVSSLQKKQAVFDLDEVVQPWAARFRDLNPGSFPGKGGHRICVALHGAGRLVGVMVVCDRVGGVPFSAEEFDLLRTIGEQIGTELLSINLSERLMESKQMEAFQTMSAFFVHDLKNTASTLSLMLQNLPKHFAEAEFRDDALCSISKSVDRINSLIRRLTLLREKLDISPVDTDLNALVTEALSGLKDSIGARVLTSFASVPEIPLDPEQMHKVVTNLVLNAADAVSEDGEIKLSTAVNGDWVVMTVSDNGCGMPRSFIAESIFHPFRSTKKDGMGIGLFQSKMIIEAHHGTVGVESEEGAGSTFRVRLPVKGGVA